MEDKKILHLPKCELQKLIIRNNIGPISAVNSRVFLLVECRRLHRSSAGPTTAAFVDYLNLYLFIYTKPIVTFTMASGLENRRARVWPMNGTLLDHVSLLPRQIRPEFGPELAAKCIPELSFQQ